MASVDVLTNQNVVARVANLPLVISTYDMVSNVYCNTKDNHPYLKSVCEAAENSVKTISSAAFNTALPFIEKLELQISFANTLACKGLDKIEKTLPILNKPSDEIVANAREAVTGAKDKTRTVVSDGVQTVMDSKVVRLVSSGVDTALSASETLLEQYLPGTEEEKETNDTGFENDRDAPSYYVRLGSLSTKVRDRAYQRAVAKVFNAVQRSQESISKLNHTMDLIEYTKTNVNGANQKVHEKLGSLIGWKTTSKSQEEIDSITDNEAEQIESRTLTIAHNLSLQLQTTCLVVVSNLKGLPQHVQVHALSVSHSAMEIYTAFSKATVLGDLSDTVLTSSRSQVNRLKDSMDNVMDYLVNNTPLNWLVGPFYPRIGSTTVNSVNAGQSTNSQPELEMQSIE